MHIPDGMLSPTVVASADVASAGMLAYAVSWVRRHFDQRRIVLMAVMSALVFALQMLNFPVAGGTSGHFSGGAAAAIMLGPWPAAIVLTTVLFVQALLFADGGIVALGANILNMAIVGPLVGYAIWRVTRRLMRRGVGTAVAAFVAAWAAVVVSALAAGVEIWLSGSARFTLIMSAMAFWHALIGVGEGLITAGLVTYILKVRPDLLGDEKTRSAESDRAVAVVLGAVAIAAGAVSFLASKAPDGLESAYFRDAAGRALPGVHAIKSPFAQYKIAGLSNQTLAGVLAGLAGVLIAGAALYGFASIVANRRAKSTGSSHSPDFHDHAHQHPAQPAHEHPHHHTSAPVALSAEPPVKAASPHSHAHPLSFERYTYLISPVHRIDPRIKILSAIVLILGIVLAKPVGPIEFAALVLLLFAVTFMARLPLRSVLLRSALVLPVAAGIALFAPLARATGGFSQAGVATAYQAGWITSWGIVSKAWLSAYVVTLVAGTTPTPKILRALRSLRVPSVFLTLLAFLYRYAESLSEELFSLHRSIASRAPELRGMRLVRLYGNLAGNLFVRAYERGERIHSAMLSRGFDGTLPVSEPLTARPADAIPIMVAVLAALALVLY